MSFEPKRRPGAALALLLAVLPLSPARATGAPSSELSAATRLPAAGLRADVGILRAAYGGLHPGLLRYNTPAQIEAALSELETKFASDRTLAEAYVAFSEFAARIRCGHTYANFYNQSEAVQEALFEAPALPFHFRWLDERMIVTRAWSAEPHLRAGAEILSIDGRPVAEILRRLLPLARADGGNDAKRVSSLEVQGNDRFEAFDVYFPLLFPKSSAGFELVVRDPATAAVAPIRVAGLTHAERLRAVRTQERGSDEAAFTLTFPAPRVALLTMPTWALYDSKWDWNGFLDDAFARLAAGDATDLVIDLRGNEGGMSIGDALIAHLIERELPEGPVVRKVRYRKVPPELLPYLDTWDRSFADWGESAIEPAGGFFRLVRYDDGAEGALFRPRAPRFGGHVWVLVGAANSSATFEFAEAVQRYGLGTLVGQTTGGNRRGINGGAFFFLRLPHSGLELDLPLIATFPVGDRPDAGIEPELAVTPTVADIAAGRDVELALVLERIARR